MERSSRNSPASSGRAMTMTELPLLPATLALPQHPAAAAAKAEGLGAVPRAVVVAGAVAEAVAVAATTRRRQHLLLLLPHPALRCPSLVPWPPTTCASSWTFWWALDSRVCQRYKEFNAWTDKDTLLDRLFSVIEEEFWALDPALIYSLCVAN